MLRGVLFGSKEVQWGGLCYWRLLHLGMQLI